MKATRSVCPMPSRFTAILPGADLREGGNAGRPGFATELKLNGRRICSAIRGYGCAAMWFGDPVLSLLFPRRSSWLRTGMSASSL
jgi:hypothetical protein